MVQNPLFQYLNFKELITVEKNRNIWNFKDVEIAIDNVKDLGWFIELEDKGNFSSVDKAEEHLYKILKELNIEVGEQGFKGYPHLILEKRGLI